MLPGAGNSHVCETATCDDLNTTGCEGRQGKERIVASCTNGIKASSTIIDIGAVAAAANDKKDVVSGFAIKLVAVIATQNGVIALRPMDSVVAGATIDFGNTGQNSLAEIERIVPPGTLNGNARATDAFYIARIKCTDIEFVATNDQAVIAVSAIEAVQPFTSCVEEDIVATIAIHGVVAVQALNSVVNGCAIDGFCAVCPLQEGAHSGGFGRCARDDKVGTVEGLRTCPHDSDAVAVRV